jgi:transcriptional regulator with XRE-family HTH domain
VHLGTLLRHVGHEVQERRHERPLTQEELAFRAGMSSSVLKCVEKGRNFTIKTIFAIAPTLDTSLGELFTCAEKRAATEHQRRIAR